MSRIIKTEKNKTNTKYRPDLPIYRLLWCKIRYFQNLYQISDDDLADALGVHIRTLRDYDRTAENVTFGKLDRFLCANKISLTELMDL